LPPKLTLVATPIGNLGDVSPRSLSVLREASFWVVEDSRVSGKLGTLLNVKRPMKVANEHTSDHALGQILDLIEAGNHAVLMTDGGAPGISDPGAKLVDGAYQRGIEVDAIPGPSAPINALMLSGFFAQRFTFLGFLPRKKQDIAKELAPFADSPYTLVIFESPHRFMELLSVCSEVLGERRYCIARELTKMNQQVFRAVLPTLPDVGTVPAKGEFTVVLEGVRRGKRL
jgi:16S rRNA (cytidine1402-2'-O)-methyltransferase